METLQVRRLRMLGVALGNERSVPVLPAHFSRTTAATISTRLSMQATMAIWREDSIPQRRSGQASTIPLTPRPRSSLMLPL